MNKDFITIDLDELRKSDLSIVLKAVHDVIKEGSIVLNEIQEQTL